MSLRTFLFFIVVVAFTCITKLINDEHYVLLNRRIWLLHVAAIISQFFFMGIYEVSYLVWLSDPNKSRSKIPVQSTRILLAFMELASSIANVLTLILFMYMMDKMTTVPQ